MQNVRKYPSFAVVLATLFLALFAPLSLAAGKNGAQFLNLGAGARPAALGGSFASVADDATAVYWNPAGMSQVETPEVAVMQNSHLVDTDYQFVGGIFPFGASALGASLYRLDHGDIERYTVADVKDGSFEASSLAGGVSMSMELTDSVFMGVTAKFFQEKIENESASGFAGDLGLHTSVRNIKIGAVLRNLGPKVKFVQEEASLPQTLHLGASTRFLNEKLLVSLEISKASDNDATFHSGVEYNLTNLLDLRAGYKITPGNEIDVDGITNVSGGLGVKLGRLNLDYAFVPFGDLGQSHQISLKYAFAKTEKESSYSTYTPRRYSTSRSNGYSFPRW